MFSVHHLGIINDTDALNIEGCLYIARCSLNIVLGDGHWTVYRSVEVQSELLNGQIKVLCLIE